MKAALISLLVAAIFAIVGGIMYSGYMDKMAKEKNVRTDVKLSDVKSGKVKPPTEYAGGVLKD